MTDLLLKELPMIMQSDTSECGLACLAMIARYYGHDTDINRLRHMLPSLSQGVSLQQISELGSMFKLEPTGLRVQVEQLPKLPTPCILHWDFSHFVLLKEVAKNEIIIHDPAAGVRHLSLDEASKLMTGIVLILEPQAEDLEPTAEKAISHDNIERSLAGKQKTIIFIFAIAVLLKFWILFDPVELSVPALRNDESVSARLGMAVGHD